MRPCLRSEKLNVRGCVCVCVSDGERGPLPPAQRVAYQRALSVDAKPIGGEGPVGGGLAGRRNVPCPTLVKQEKMDAAIPPGPVPNGFPGGMGACPPRGNPTSNLNTYFFASLAVLERREARGCKHFCLC